MSDTEAARPLKVNFPDGTSKVFQGNTESIKAQAKAYWSSKKPAAQAPAAPAPKVTREQIDQFRMQFFNTHNPNANAPMQAAHALAKNPNDPKWRPALEKMSPIAQYAIAERAKELGEAPPKDGPDITDPNFVFSPFTLPQQLDALAIHDVIGEMMHGPEGYRQLKHQTGAIAELTRQAESLADPKSIAMMLGGGAIASAGKLGAAAVTSAVYGAGAKGAYDKAKQGDYGGAAVDALLPPILHGITKAVGKAGAKPAEPERVLRYGGDATPRAPGIGGAPPPEAPRSGLGAGPKTPPNEPPKSSSTQQPPPRQEPPAGNQQQGRQQAPPRQPNTGPRTGTRKPFSQEQGEPQPPPAYSDKATWQAYRDAHEQWRNDAKSTVPPKNPYENYEQWEARRDAARQGPTWEQKQEQTRQAEEKRAQDQARGEERRRQAEEARRQEQARQQREQEEARQRFRDAQEQARRNREAREQQRRQAYNQANQRQQQSQPPPQQEAPPYDATKETHPEVKKFNDYAESVDPRIKDAKTVTEAKQRLVELGKLNKRTKQQNAEFGALSNRLSVHSNGLEDFAKQFEASTGRKLNLNTKVDLDPRAKPSSREDVMHAVREAIRSGVKFDKAFPEASQTSNFPDDVSRETFTDERETNDVGRTSLNQVPALFKKAPLEEGKTNIDIGGGKYDQGTEFLASKGVKSSVLDPYNRTPEHNQSVHEQFTSKPADTATVANVLNVIEDAGIRQDVIKNAGKYVKPGGKIYFGIYEGNRSGTGAKTSTGTYQNNRSTVSYLPEIQKVFPNAKIENGYIVASKERFSAFNQGEPNEKAVSAPTETAENRLSESTQKPASTGGSAQAGRGESVSGEVQGTIKTKRVGIAGKLSVSTPETHYSKSSNTLYFNKAASTVLRRVFGTSQKSAGWAAHRISVARAINALQYSVELRDVPRVERETLKSVLKEAADHAPGGHIKFQEYVPGRNLKTNLLVNRHENVHIGQQLTRDLDQSPVGAGIGSNSLLTTEQEEEIAKSPGMDRLTNKLRWMGYKEHQIHKEAPAILASLDHARFGLSDQEAEDLLVKYAQHIVSNHGIDALATIFERGVGKSGEISRMARAAGGKYLHKQAGSPETVDGLKAAETHAFPSEPLPPKSGAGPVGRLLHHGSKVVNAANEWDAAHVSAQVRAELMTRNVLPKTMSDAQKEAVGEWLVGNRLNYAAKVSTDPDEVMRAQNHPQYRTDAQLAALASDPMVKDAIEEHRQVNRPVIDKLAESAGVSGQATTSSNPYYIRLVPTSYLNPGSKGFTQSPGGRASWESRARPKSTGARNRAQYTGTEYLTDVGEIYRYDLRDKEPKARLNDLWRTLDSEGLILTRPRGASNWMPPEGYTGDEIQGKYSSAPPDIISKYGQKAVVYLPKDVVQTMDEISRPEGPTGHRGTEIAKRISRMLVWGQLGTNPIAAAGHIYRQTAMVRGATEFADVKRNPLHLVGAALTPLGTAVKGAIIGFRNVDDPVYQQIIQELVQANAISPRSMEIKDFDKMGKLAQYQHLLHDTMFGLPHGQGVNGWAIRAVLEGELVRRRYEKNADPERMRAFAQNFGFYTRRISPWLGPLAQLNPFVRTTAARYLASVRQMGGVSGLKAPGGTKEQAAQWLGTFALKALGVVTGLVVINRMLSGKWPWENGKGHETEINLGNGHFMPLGHFMVEAETGMQLSGLTSRMHREKIEKELGVQSFNRPYKPPKKRNMAAEALGDLAVGTANTATNLVSSPGLTAGLGLIGRKPYWEYAAGQNAPTLMPSQPPHATVPQEVFNYARDLMGGAQILPQQGYADTDYTHAVVDYITQHAIREAYRKPPKIKKFGR